MQVPAKHELVCTCLFGVRMHHLRKVGFSVVHMFSNRQTFFRGLLFRNVALLIARGLMGPKCVAMSSTPSTPTDGVALPTRVKNKSRPACHAVRRISNRLCSNVAHCFFEKWLRWQINRSYRAFLARSDFESRTLSLEIIHVGRSISFGIHDANNMVSKANNDKQSLQCGNCESENGAELLTIFLRSLSPFFAEFE